MKTRFLALLSTFAIMLTMAPAVFAISGTVKATDAQGTEANNFLTTEDIYVDGVCSTAVSHRMDIYIVEHKETWANDDVLTDVSGSVESVISDGSGNMPSVTLAWATPLAIGSYDIVLDTNLDGKYHEDLDCIDTIDEIGFSVAQATGSGSAALGANDPGDHEWVIGVTDANNVMMHLALTAGELEDVDITAIEITESGTGDEAVGVTVVKIVEDEDADGAYDEEVDTLLGSGVFTAEESVLDIEVTGTIEAEGTKDILFVYVMGDTHLEADTYQLEVSSVIATGTLSEDEIILANLPISSGVGTVVSAATEVEEEGDEEVETGLEDEELETGAEEEEEDQMVDPDINIAEPFTDIEGHWAEDYISDLRLREVVKGKDGKFNPDVEITRAELTKMVLLAFEYDIYEVIEEDDLFTDVTGEEWYAFFLATAKGYEIVSGYDDGSFKPNASINRVEALKIMMEAAEVDTASSLAVTFPDTIADEWYAPYINYGYGNGIIKGYSTGEYKGMFRPNHTATRGEVAKMISVLKASVEEVVTE